MAYFDICPEDITPDADVGGYGVMISFLVIAWMTMLVSAWDSWRTWRHSRHLASQNHDGDVEMSASVITEGTHPSSHSHSNINNNGPAVAVPEDLPSSSSPPPGPEQAEPGAGPARRQGTEVSHSTRPQAATRRSTWAKELLIRLIDLQIVTGAGISIAGLIQLAKDSSTLYHYQLINSYWWLTMQSLWIVRDDFLNLALLKPSDNPDQELPHPTVTPKVNTKGKRDTTSKSHFIRTLTTFIRIIKPKQDARSLSPFIRILAVLVSTVLGCVFQAWMMVNENKKFDDSGEGGPCYNYLYKIWDWTGSVWVAMTGSYAIALILLLFERTRVRILDRADHEIQGWREKVYGWWEGTWRTVEPSWWKKFCCGLKWILWWKIICLAPKPTEKTQNRGQAFISVGHNTSSNEEMLSPPPYVKRLLEFLNASFWAGLGWFAIQFLAICAYGDGTYLFVFFITAGFNVWTTVDIISMRILNEPLLGDDEKKWGFGQILPLVLIASVFLPSMGVPGHGTKQKSWGVRRARTMQRNTQRTKTMGIEPRRRGPVRLGRATL